MRVSIGPAILTFAIAAACAEPGVADLQHDAAELRAENTQMKEQVLALKQELEELKFGSDRLLAKAEREISEKDYGSAEGTISALLERHPDSPPATQARLLLARIKTTQAEQAAAEANRAAETARRQEEERKRATAAMKASQDEVRGITWYKDRSTRALGNQAHLYFGVKGGQVMPLRLVLQYYGDDWLFVRSVTVKADDQVYRLPIECKRDNSGGSVWEWSDAPLDGESALALQAMLAAKRTIIRFEGDQYYKDFTLPAPQKAALANVIKAHAALGGDAPLELLADGGR